MHQRSAGQRREGPLSVSFRETNFAQLKQRQDTNSPITEYRNYFLHFALGHSVCNQPNLTEQNNFRRGALGIRRQAAASQQAGLHCAIHVLAHQNR